MANDRTDAIAAAQGRRAARADDKAVREEWFIAKTMNHINLPMQARVRICTEMLKNRVIINISRPVTKTVVRRVNGGSYTRITNRSKPGEFPKADTTLLMKTIFSDYAQPEPDRFDGYVGTPLDYGLRLELFMFRSFLVRTLRAVEDRFVRILTAKIQ